MQPARRPPAQRPAPAPVRPTYGSDDYPAEPYVDEAGYPYGGAPDPYPGRAPQPDWDETAPPAARRVPSRPQIGMPPALTAAMGGVDVRLLGVAGGAVLSLILMLGLAAARVDTLPPWFPIHIAANGAVDLYGTQSVLWRLPLGLAMVTLMNLGAGALLGRKVPFAAAVLIGVLPLLHLFAWLAFALIAF
jgi:hypothetical protein